jgi:PKD repeat protein
MRRNATPDRNRTLSVAPGVKGKTFLVCVGLMVLLMLLPAVVSAKQLWVATTGKDTSSAIAGTQDFPYKTISFAITTAYADTSGTLDTVLVQPGTYKDTLRFYQKPLVVKSVSGAKVTIVSGDSIRTPVEFKQSPITTVLNGFTVTRGNPYGVLISCCYSELYEPNSSPEIKNCIIRRNYGSGGIVMNNYSNANIHNNLIDSNVTVSGGGVSCYNSSPSIWSNTIRANSVSSSVSGGGISCLNSSPAIWNNIIQGNSVTSTTGAGGGISVTGHSGTLPKSPVLIQNNLILNNSCFNASGVRLNTTYVYFVNNLVYGNTSNNLAVGGVEVIGDSCLVRNNIIANNFGYGLKLNPSQCDTAQLRTWIQYNYFFTNNNEVLSNCPIDTVINHFDVDPKFINGDAGDFHLQPTSTLIDAGAPLIGASFRTVDFDGFPRKTGTKVDIGPYERVDCALNANFNMPSEICVDSTVEFENLSTGKYTLAIWDYGNGVVDSFLNTDGAAPLIAPKAVYKAVGNYNVTVKLSCPYDQAAPATKVISVIGKPHAAFQVDANQGCAPLAAKFTNTASGGSRTDTWYFGDDSTSTESSPEHNFAQAGVYVVKLVSINACGADSVTDTITVKGVSVANFVADPIRGSSVLPVTFTGSATNNPTGWLWDFGDGYTATTRVANHNYSKPGIYDVSLVATNECGVGAVTTLKSLITVYGFNLRAVDSDTTKRLQQEFRARIDTLYGLFSRNITLSSSITPTPRRGSVTVSFNPTTAQALDTITATAILSRDVAAGSYQLRVIATSVSNEPADTVTWSFNSHPDTLIRLPFWKLDPDTTSIRLDSSGVVFDSVQIDTSAIVSIRVRNASTDLANLAYLHVTNVATTDTQFVFLDTLPDPIQPNGSFDIRVKFKPTSLGEKSAFMTITSDDPVLPVIRVALKANVIPERTPPVVVRTNPARDTVGVLIGSGVYFTLSEAIDSASVTAGSIVAQSRKLRTSVPGAARLSAQTRIVFVPQQRYLPYDTIDVTLLATVRDLSRNTLDSDGDGKGNGSPADDYTYWFVTGPAVYPGDCNNDGIVDESDILPLGVFYGLTGPQRGILEREGWGPKQAVEWSDNRLTYADADGNGVIDVYDVSIIATNWGLTHTAGHSTFPPDFDFRPYRDGLSRLRSSVEGMSGSEAGKRMLQILSEVSDVPTLPRSFSLSQNHPNPFNPNTRIDYALPDGASVKLTVYNILGQMVRILVDGYQEAGFRYVDWDGADQSGREVASGVYFYKFEAGSYREIRKMLKLQ